MEFTKQELQGKTKQNQIDYETHCRELKEKEEIVQEKIQQLHLLKKQYDPDNWFDIMVFEFHYFSKRMFIYGPIILVLFAIWNSFF